MIRKDHLEFLKEVKKNNNREWFEDQKLRYKKLKEELLESIHKIALELQKHDDNLDVNPGNVELKTKVFRIYRDLRFTDDKTPYKTNFAGEINNGKMKDGMPGYYIHIEPGGSFIAGGVHMPDSKYLKKLRKKIDTKYKVLDDILNEKSFKKIFPEGLSDERKLKTSPRDYPSDHPGLEYLNHKDFTVFKSLTNKEVLSDDFENKVVDICKQIAKLNEFLYLS